MEKKARVNKQLIFRIFLVILLLAGFFSSGYFLYNINKSVSQQIGLVSEQKIKIQSLEGKVNELKDNEIEIISKLNVLQSMSNLSRIDKQCELSGLKIIKAEYLNGKVNLRVDNGNNVAIEGFNLKAYLGSELITSDKLENISAYEVKEYVISSEKPDEAVITPKILIDGDISICNKEVRSRVSELADINGEFNVTGYFIFNGENKEVNLAANFVQNGVDVSGTTSARKQDGSYGQAFEIKGSINDKIINLKADKVELPAGSIEGINLDLIIDIVLEGLVENNNKIEGSDMGDVVLTVKDYPAPGISISIEGVFSADRL